MGQWGGCLPRWQLFHNGSNNEQRPPVSLWQVFGACENITTTNGLDVPTMSMSHPTLVGGLSNHKMPRHVSR